MSNITLSITALQALLGFPDILGQLMLLNVQPKLR